MLQTLKLILVRSSLVFIFIVLSACVSWQDKIYKFTPSEATATLYLDIPARLKMGVFRNDKCQLYKQGSNLTTAIRQGPSIPALEISNKFRFLTKKNDYIPINNTIKKVKIPASKNSAFSFLFNEETLGDRFVNCEVTMAFTPTANSEYHGIFRFVEDKKWCHIAIIDLTKSKNTGKLEKPAGIKRIPSNCN